MKRSSPVAISFGFLVRYFAVEMFYSGGHNKKRLALGRRFLKYFVGQRRSTPVNLIQMNMVTGYLFSRSSTPLLVKIELVIPFLAYRHYRPPY